MNYNLQRWASSKSLYRFNKFSDSIYKSSSSASSQIAFSRRRHPYQRHFHHPVQLFIIIQLSLSSSFSCHSHRYSVFIVIVIRLSLSSSFSCRCHHHSVFIVIIIQLSCHHYSVVIIVIIIKLTLALSFSYHCHHHSVAIVSIIQLSLS